jgi:Fe-S-cluster containining protein
MEQTALLLLFEKSRDAVTSAGKTESIHGLLAELTYSHQLAEDLLDLQDQDERSLIACHAGCDHCCVVNVSVSHVEGISIVRFLQQVDTAERDVMIDRLDHLWRRIRGLDDEERLALRHRCAFLGDNGLCQIYPARPLFCRSVTSIDPEACKKAVCCKLQGETSTILMNQYQQQLYEALYCAVSEGLEQAGLDGRSFQLTGLVRYLLKNSEKNEAVLRPGELSWDHLYA